MLKNVLDYKGLVDVVSWFNWFIVCLFKKVLVDFVFLKKLVLFKIVFYFCDKFEF